MKIQICNLHDLANIFTSFLFNNIGNDHRQSIGLNYWHWHMTNLLTILGLQSYWMCFKLDHRLE